MNSGVNSGGGGFAGSGPTIVRLPPPPGSSSVESSSTNNNNTSNDQYNYYDNVFSTIGPVDPYHHPSSSSSSVITAPPSSSVVSSSSWPYEQGTWDNDIYSSHCRKCHKEFDIFLHRKHHCRLCGQIFCHDCTNTKSLIPHSALVLRRNQKEDGNHGFAVAATATTNYYDASVLPTTQQHHVVDDAVPNLENRILLARQPQRTCYDCYLKLQPYQLELQSMNSNSIRYNYIDDSDPVRRLCNSPIAFTLGHEVRKAAYALSNILPGSSSSSNHSSNRNSRNSGPFQDSDAILYSYQPTSSSSSSDYGCQIPTTNNNIGSGGGGCRTIDPTLRNVDNMSIPPKLLARAYGIAIVTCCKGGFGFAGIEFGTGLVVARRRQPRQRIGQQQQLQQQFNMNNTNNVPINDGGGGDDNDNNEWTAPCAIGIAGFAWGALLGAQVSDHVFLLMTLDAVRLFTSSNGRSIQLGADVGVAIGPVGRSAEADWSATTGPSRDLLDEQHQGRGGGVIMAPIFTYSLSKGLYAGVSLDGRLLMTRDHVNEKFYGRAVTAHELLSGSVPNPPAAQPLYDALKRCRVYGERAGGAHVVGDGGGGGGGELPIIRGRGSRTLDVSTIEHDYYSSDDNYGMNEYGMNGTPIRNGNSFVGGLGGITHSVRDDGFVDYGVCPINLRPTAWWRQQCC
jgi:lipid-binding SYLF domain-containing protein